MNARASLLLSSLVLASPSLLACSSVSAPADDLGAASQADTAWNGLNNNGLNNNGLNNNGLNNNGLNNNGLNNNGLNNNGLTSGGLAAWTGIGAILDTNPYASEFLTYVVNCALPATASVSIASAADPAQSYTFTGGMGLAPEWGASDASACDATCQEWVSACVISRINYLGVHVPLSMRGANAGLALVEGEAAGYPNREATYYGNVFSSPLELHACRTTGDDQTLIDRPCGHGADVSGCIIDAVGECGSVCTVNDPVTGYYGSCTAGGVTYAPAVTVYRQP